MASGSSLSPKSWMENLDQALAQNNILTRHLDMIEKKTNIKKRYTVIVLCSLISVYLVFGYAAHLLCNVIGFVYPAYISCMSSFHYCITCHACGADFECVGLAACLCLWLTTGILSAFVCTIIGLIYPACQTVKAIESPEKDDDTEWLMYWVVFATFSVVEFFSDILLSWFPFYFLGKCIFLLWCMSPISWNGSKVIYHKFIRPFILRNEGQIDSFFSKVRGGAKELASKARDDATELAADVTAAGIKAGIKKDE